MATQVAVKIELELLRVHLSTEHQREWTHGEVLDWLGAVGFSRNPDGAWRVSEADLGQLDPSEVSAVELLPETIDQARSASSG